MQVIVNGEPMMLAEACSVADLLNHLTLTGRRIAVEVNLEIVPRSQHGQHQLREGDRVEVVGAIGGG